MQIIYSEMDNSEIKEHLLFFIKLPFELFYFCVLLFYCFARLVLRKLFPKPPKSLDGEIILLTGASNGIGREMAIYLAENYPKAKLVLWDCEIGDDSEKTTLSIVQNLGVNAASYKVDITDRHAVERTAVQVTKDMGSVTILVNNAGITGVGTILDQSPEIIEKTINVNLLSHFWMVRTFLPKMIENNHGHILTVSSLASYSTMRYGTPYAASKHGLRGYLQSIKSELRVHPKPTNGIKFSTLYPYFLKTRMTKRVILRARFSYFNRFIDPTLVAEKAIEGLRRDEEQIVVPWDMEIAANIMRVLPNHFQERLEDWISHESTIMTEYFN